MRAQRNEHDSASDRISRLETAVDSINDQLGGVVASIAQVQNSLNQSRKTDWGVVFAGGLVILGLYAASIHPLEEKIASLRGDLNKLGQISYETGQRNQEIKDRFIKVENTQGQIVAEMEEWRKNGSPSVRDSLAVIQWRLDHDRKP